MKTKEEQRPKWVWFNHQTRHFSSKKRSRL